MSKRIRKHSDTLIFLGPCIAIFLFYSIIPLVYSLVLSFFSWEWAAGAELKFFGVGNYLRAASDTRTAGDLLHTVIMCIGIISAEILLGLGVALLLNTGLRGSRYFRVAYLLPILIAPVAVAFNFSVILHEDRGPINYLLSVAGLQPVPWMSKDPFATLAVMLIVIWQWTPFMALLILAGLQTLPVEVLEMAEIDGASGWKLLRNILLPMLRPVIVVAVLFRLIELFKMFDVPFVLTRGGPGTSTELIVQYIYLQAFKFFSMGYAAALSNILIVIVTIVGLQFVRYVIREVRI